jgi:folate-binding protein YgfZ
MPDTKIALLADRGVVSVTGADAGKLLQGVLTNDIDLLAERPAIHAGLLSPQGKILFEFFVARVENGFLLETARARAGDLAKRLTLYKLRAKVDIADVSADHTVAAIWDGAIQPAARAIAFPDPRDRAMGMRVIVSLSSDWLIGHSGAEAATADDYHAHRIAHGVPEGDRDYPLGDTYPHEALFDRLAGVAFDKGCYVGQEVVSRMQHKTVVRKRVTRVTGRALHSGLEVLAGQAPIGTVGSVASGHGLALVRLDRVVEALDKGLSLTVGGEPVSFDAEAIAGFRAATVGRPA